jgi:hypothetical protein
VFDPVAADACLHALGTLEPNALCNGPDAFFGQPAFDAALALCASVMRPPGGTDAGCFGDGGGAPCGFAPEGAPCVADTDCSMPLVCVGARCAAPGTQGASCSADTQCAHDMFCSPVSGTTSGGACTYRHENGAACAMATECRSGECYQGFCLQHCRGARHD